MNKAIRGHNLRTTIVMALIAMLFLVVALVFALQPAATTSDREANPAIHATSADGSGGSSITHDPYNDRHAEGIDRCYQDGLC